LRPTTSTWSGRLGTLIAAVTAPLGFDGDVALVSANGRTILVSVNADSACYLIHYW
jgi:hypothetical protein